MIKEHKAIINDKGTQRKGMMPNKRVTKSKGAGMGDYEETDESESDDDSSENEKTHGGHTSHAGKTLNPRQRYEKDKMGRA
jgi:hypothetical protein